jgi:hypothetical protein
MGLPVPSLEDGNIREMTDYITRCMEVTNEMVEEMKYEGRVDEWCNIWHGSEDEEFCHFQ